MSYNALSNVIRKNKMNILIVGNGGREHALAWKLAQSSKVTQIFIAPGNGGTADEPRCKNIDIAATDIKELIHFAQKNTIDLTIIGPEAPLALGIVDQFQQHGLACFGPSQAAARLESSKSFCKQFFKDNDIPTAKFSHFTNSDCAIKYMQKQPLPIVIKASGLAAGKGVIIAEDRKTAETAITTMLDHNQFNTAKEGIVIEAFLEGEELSFIALVDGKNVIPLASSQDHKRLLNNDQGPNTGGMGAYSPAPICTPELQQKIMQTVMQPTVSALAKAGTPYIGFLYAGLMVNPNNDINVLEFNCRLGDPETQPLLFRMQSDLVELCLLALNGKLNNTNIQWDPRSALCVVMATQGYPQEYPKGEVISGLNHVNPCSKVFHAGTVKKKGQTLTAGGRVLGVTSLGSNLTTAHENAYRMVKKLNWEHCHYRLDIGAKGLANPIAT
jgi:phosphoribosylamine---glycine ligase